MTVPAEIAATGFTLPGSYVRACGLGLGHLAPWRFLRGDRFLDAYAQVNAHSDDAILLPFAERVDCGELACFEVLPGPAEAVTVLEGERVIAEFPTFWAWFRQGIEDMIHAAPDASFCGDPALSWEWFQRRADASGPAPRARVSTSG